MWFWSTEIWISIILLLITLFLYKWWIYRKLPPGPWGVPLLGYLPFLDPKHTYLTLTQLSKKYGPIYSLNMGNVLAIVLSDPKIIRQALNKDALSGRADLYLPNKIFDGNGLIMTKGTVWKQQRKFTVSCLKNLGATKFGPKRERMETLALCAVDNLAQTLSSSSDIEEGVDIWNLLRHTIGNVINQLLFGRSFLEDDPIWIKLQYLSDEGVSKMDEAGVVNFLPYLRIFPNYQKSINFVVDGLTLTHKIYENIINEHKGDEEDVINVYLKEMEKNCNDCNSTFTRKQLLFLLGDLFGAGLDTTARTFNWFLLYVASHPHIQAKLHQEIDFVCGDKPCKLDDIPRLPYLEACITESQRIRSVVPIGVPHGALEDCELESYTIPKGSIIFPLQWAVHMDENIWPEPNLFKPERFLDDKGNFFKPDAFIPFQPGKRICVGEELAKIMLFLFSSNILKNFHIKLPSKATENGADPLEGHFDLVLLKPNQSNLIFLPRKLL